MVILKQNKRHSFSECPLFCSLFYIEIFIFYIIINCVGFKSSTSNTALT